ncbi:sigma-E factor negative regulatory protein [Rhodanobacter sp. C03]|uniref:sigma-E factor negative regulatory protein n=1 Tax=Rhodanobacter sp. C03 TaxID=1945858 RepID=UPI00098681A4|nr:sigma-E factor negative regulatory protein [Rhodanobacter sp. C03]OOG56272.1 anti-anti-sigma factor [Rhodanobacter sp. C03]
MNQTDMNQDVRETLSTGIDGELSKEQLRFLLRRIDHDAALQQVWTRYHLARDGLRRQLPSMATAGFADRVMLAIEQESVPVAAATRRHHWLRWSAGGAIAASVAAAALMITQPTGDAERNATAALASQQQTRAVAQVVPANRPTTPAAVPPWLSGNSAGLLSQQASATLGASFDVNQPLYTRRLSGYPSLPRYRTLDNKDGSYLLLLDPEQRATPVNTSRQAAAVAQ